MDKTQGKPLTAQEQLEMDIMAEAELARLQRQYRIMEGDKNAFFEETTNKLKKQKKMIESLRKEHDDMMADLSVTTSFSNRRKDVRDSVEIRKLLDNYDVYVEAIRKEKAGIKEVDYQIKKVEKQVAELRAKQTTEKQLQENISVGNKNLEAQQNKLDTTIKRFCSILAENKKMRIEIDHLLIERSHFNVIWEKLLTNLHNGKKIMIELIEQATVAYDQREEWGQKLQALKVRAQNDLLFHTQEMRELFRQLDHDANLQDFLSVKGQKRIMRDLERKEQMKRQEAKENLERQLQNYKDTLMKIQEFVGEEDIPKLVAQFVKQEEENFALFNYVNELNHELEMLTDNLADLREKIEEQIKINEATAEQQKDTLESLRNDLEVATREAEEEESRLHTEKEKLSKMMSGIENLFRIVKCDAAPILELLGENGHINNYNVLLYLGLLENKVNELAKTVHSNGKTLPLPRLMKGLYPAVHVLFQS